MLRSFQTYPILRDEKLLDLMIMRLRLSVGICPICGSATLFYKFSENLRETGTCVVCKSTNRHRQVALVLLNAIVEMTGSQFSSIKAFVQKTIDLLQISGRERSRRAKNEETSGHHNQNSS